MSTAKKLKSNTESYSPIEKPPIVNFAQEMSKQKEYKDYKNIEFYMDTVILKESFKFAGVTSENNPNFQNINKFHEEYKELMINKYAPYTEVGFSGDVTKKNDYIFGCQVYSLDDLPDGLIGVDTGVKKFESITFRTKTAFELVGGADGPGDGMKTAYEYIKEDWLPKNTDKVYSVNEEHLYFNIKKENINYWMGLIEVYKVDIGDQPEMCFYIPLKD